MWRCPLCRIRNPETVIKCLSCETINPDSSEVQVSVYHTILYIFITISTLYVMYRTHQQQAQILLM